MAIEIVLKMGRKRDVPFKRGKLEIWASGVIYAIAQTNFLFDENSPYHISAEDICDFFKTKKSTVSKKGTQICDMLNLSPFDKDFTIAPIVSENNDEGMDEFFDEAFDLYAEGKVSQAINHLDLIKEGHPEYLRALFYKSMFLAESDEKEAFNLFQEALFRGFQNGFELDLDDDMDVGEIDELLDELIDYEDPEDLFALGLMDYNVGDFDQALYYFDLALEKDKDNCELWYFKALSLANFGEFKKAIKAIDKAIKIDSEDGRFWNDKGNFLASMNHVSKAEKCFDKALKLNPKDSVIWANKGFLYLQNGKYQKALNSYDNACKLEMNVHNLVGKVNVYIELDDLKNAEKYLNKASQIDDEDMEYLITKAQLLMNQKRFDESLIYWDKCLEIDDENPEIWMFKGLVYGMLDREDEFEKCIEKACEFDPMIMFALEDFIE